MYAALQFGMVIGRQDNLYFVKHSIRGISPSNSKENWTDDTFRMLMVPEERVNHIADLNDIRHKNRRYSCDNKNSLNCFISQLRAERVAHITYHVKYDNRRYICYKYKNLYKLAIINSFQPDFFNEYFITSSSFIKKIKENCCFIEHVTCDNNWLNRIVSYEEQSIIKTIDAIVADSMLTGMASDELQFAEDYMPA